MIEITGLFKSAAVVIITANAAVSCALGGRQEPVSESATGGRWIPFSLREIIPSGGGGRCGERAVEVPLHQEMAGAER